MDAANTSLPITTQVNCFTVICVELSCFMVKPYRSGFPPIPLFSMEFLVRKVTVASPNFSLSSVAVSTYTSSESRVLSTRIDSFQATTILCTPICTQPYYPGQTDGGLLGEFERCMPQSNGAEQSYLESDLLPSINDFKFSAAVNATNNGMWAQISSDFWASMPSSQVHSQNNCDAYRI